MKDYVDLNIIKLQNTWKLEYTLHIINLLVYSIPDIIIDEENSFKWGQESCLNNVGGTRWKRIGIIEKLWSTKSSNFMN